MIGARGDMQQAILVLAGALLFAASACAKEVHLDCAQADRTAMVDIDTDRAFLQIMWGDGVAEEYKEGDSYLSGSDKYGRKEKVVYVMGVEHDVVTFGTDRLCLEDGEKKCAGQHARHRLDINRGEMKYDDGDSIAVLTCHPAPPGRKF